MSTEVFAIYFPSWHPDAHYAKWYGEGFSEWALVKNNTPLFEGHRQPKEPLWGFFDESEPEWMEKQIDLAADHGLTGFIFDWFWYEGEKFLERALDDGFLHSANRNRLKFSLMWANHTWGVWPAMSGSQGMSGNENQSGQTLLPMRHSAADFEAVIEHCCDRYFNQPNYWRVGGLPAFTLYDLDILIRQLGSQEAAADCLRRAKAVAERRGFGGLHLVANIGCCDDNEYCCGWGRVAWARKLGFDAVFAYNIVRSASYKTLPDSMPVYDYSEFMASHQLCWGNIERGGLPHYPSVTLGLDVSPRWHRGVTFPMDFKKLHYEPVAINNTPEKFGELLAAALERAKAGAVVVNAWNEWTEGMYLLPERQHGDAYLKALLKTSGAHKTSPWLV